MLKEDIYCTRDFHFEFECRVMVMLAVQRLIHCMGPHTGFIWYESSSCYSIIPSLSCHYNAKLLCHSVNHVAEHFSVWNSGHLSDSFLHFFYEHMSVELHTSPILVQLCCTVYSCHPLRCVSIHVAGLFGLEWTLVARACWSKGALKGKQMSFSKQRFLHCMVPRTSTSMQSAPCVQSAKP